MHSRPLPVPHVEVSIRPWSLALAAFAAVLAADLALKAWALDALTEPIPITEWLYLALHRNPGIFLGGVPVSAVAVTFWSAMLLATVWLGWRMVTSRRPAVGVGYALAAGGLIGNLLDRVNGAVIDYVGLGPLVGERWAFFNLADLALVGGALVLGTVLLQRTTPARSDPPQSRPAPADPLNTQRETRRKRTTLPPYVRCRSCAAQDGRTDAARPAEDPPDVPRGRNINLDQNSENPGDTRKHWRLLPGIDGKHTHNLADPPDDRSCIMPSRDLSVGLLGNFPTQQVIATLLAPDTINVSSNTLCVEDEQQFSFVADQAITADLRNRPIIPNFILVYKQNFHVIDDFRTEA